MGWSIGYDGKWKRDIGYGVPAYCDFPGCWTEIDRGLTRVCGGQPYGGELGCGLYFCEEHLYMNHCIRCAVRNHPYNSAYSQPFPPKPEHPKWVLHKLTDESWQQWREANPEEVEILKKLVSSNQR